MSKSFLSNFAMACALSTPLMLGSAGLSAEEMLRGTGDLGLIIERATGSILIVETTNRTTLKRVEGLGDISHASAV